MSGTGGLEWTDRPVPFGSIFHPTDCSSESTTAFLHALRLAVAAVGELVVMHVGEADRNPFAAFPRVRPVLERWGVLPQGSTKADVQRLGLSVRKVHRSGSPREALAEYLDSHRCDLVVLATHQYDGLARLQHASVAAPVARHSQLPTLFVPSGVEGFVDAATGLTRLRRLLIPVGTTESGEQAADAAVRLGDGTGGAAADVCLLHAGVTMPPVREPVRPGWRWSRVVRQGARVATILDAAADTRADLIVMATRGHDSLADALWGSTAEQVVRGVRCPVLVVPDVA